MCGRFTLTADGELIQQQFDLQLIPEAIAARYNIAPGQPIAVITNNDAAKLTFHQWGLIPSWSKDAKIGNRLINARAETLHEKPSFKNAFKRRRCLIPANGFYEWAKHDNIKKPMYIHLKDHELFAFAGLWETWHSPHGDEITTCTIITTEPNSVIKPLHHRMAVILRPEDYKTWLSPEEMLPESLQPLLQPYDANRMEAYEVSRFVNSPANDTPQCIAPSDSPKQPTLL